MVQDLIVAPSRGELRLSELSCASAMSVQDVRSPMAREVNEF
jgi:hypothetical protein